jgi:hypothetical protein
LIAATQTSPLINTDDTDLQRQKPMRKSRQIGKSAKKKTNKAGCGTPKRVNLSYQFQSKIGTF